MVRLREGKHSNLIIQSLNGPRPLGLTFTDDSSPLPGRPERVQWGACPFPAGKKLWKSFFCRAAFIMENIHGVFHHDFSSSCLALISRKSQIFTLRSSKVPGGKAHQIIVASQDYSPHEVHTLKLAHTQPPEFHQNYHGSVPTDFWL